MFRISLSGIRRSKDGESTSPGHIGDIVPSRSEKITIRIPETYLRSLDFLVEMDDFPSRSEAIRSAIRDMIYNRVDLVTEKVKKMREAEEKIADMKKYLEEYLQR